MSHEIPQFLLVVEGKDIVGELALEQDFVHLENEELEVPVQRLDELGALFFGIEKSMVLEVHQQGEGHQQNHCPKEDFLQPPGLGCDNYFLVPGFGGHTLLKGKGVEVDSGGGIDQDIQLLEVLIIDLHVHQNLHPLLLVLVQFEGEKRSQSDGHRNHSCKDVPQRDNDCLVLRGGGPVVFFA